MHLLVRHNPKTLLGGKELILLVEVIGHCLGFCNKIMLKRSRFKREMKLKEQFCVMTHARNNSSAENVKG